MSSLLNLVFHNMDRDEQVQLFVEARFSKTKLLSKRIMSLRVAVTKLHLKQLNQDEYKVSINLVAPGSRLISRSSEEHSVTRDVYSSISNAFDSLDRQLEQKRGLFPRSIPQQGSGSTGVGLMEYKNKQR